MLTCVGVIYQLAFLLSIGRTENVCLLFSLDPFRFGYLLRTKSLSYHMCILFYISPYPTVFHFIIHVRQTSQPHT